MKKMNNKSFLLSVVALILSLCMLTGVTYTWIDSISSIQVISPSATERITLDSTTNSVMKITADKTVIDLGSYFNESGDMHLTACSGNGKDFFFKSSHSESGEATFRRGTANDVNVNYISATFKVNSAESMVFWLNELPTLTAGETSITEYLRCAITVDGKMTVLADKDALSDNTYKCVNSTALNLSNDEALSSCNAYSTQSYIFPEDTEDEINYLFFTEKNVEKTVNIKMWIEDPKSELSQKGINIHNQDLTLKLNMIATKNVQTIYFKDYTFNSEKINLVKNDSDDSVAMYLCLADDVDTYWKFEYMGDSDGTYKVDIPSIYVNKKIHFLSCDGNYGAGEFQFKSSVRYDYRWDTKLPIGEKIYYSAIGALATGTNAKEPQTNGSWENAMAVYVDEQYGFDVNSTKMIMTDTEAEKNATMYYDDTVGAWKGYIFVDERNILFTSKIAGVDDMNWGYCDDTGNQIRTGDNNTYTIYDKEDGEWGASLNSDDDLVSSYSLKGSFNDWKGTPMLFSDKANNIAYASVELEKGTSYPFKIYSNNSKTWYGNGTTYTFGAGGTSSVENVKLTTATEGSNNSIISISSTYGGTVLFIYDGKNQKLSLKYTPSVAPEGDVRAYVMINKAMSNSTVTAINHWGDSTSDVADNEREATYVSTFGQDHLNNCFTLNSGWSTTGSWSHKGSSNSKELFFVPSSDWNSAGAWFAAYYFKDSGGYTWSSFSYDSSAGCYRTEIPSGSWNKVIFVRKASGSSGLNWNNVWNQTDNISLDRGLSNVTYNLYYVNMDADAEYMQWKNSAGELHPDRALGGNIDDGYKIGNPVNGMLYAMARSQVDNGCWKTDTNLQKVPTDLTVSSTNTTVGTKLTFSAKVNSQGTAWKQQNVSFYVKNINTGTSRMVGSTWTPLRAGTYEVTARADDGYITTDACEPITVTVN